MVAVLADALRKSYPRSTTPALAGFDLAVAAGTVHGLLGPNGAGKTTAVSSTAEAARVLFGNPAWGGESWIARHAVAPPSSGRC